MRCQCLRVSAGCVHAVRMGLYTHGESIDLTAEEGLVYRRWGRKAVRQIRITLRIMRHRFP